MSCDQQSKKPKPEFPPLLEPGLKVLSRADLFALTQTGFKSSVRRPGLWQSLSDFCDELRSLGIAPCRIWLDGSFLTHKIDPDDIDLVVELDGSVYDQLSPSAVAFIHTLKNQPFHHEPRCLHTFTFLNRPVPHVDYGFFLAARRQWEYDFGHALLSKEEKGIAVLEVLP